MEARCSFCHKLTKHTEKEKGEGWKRTIYQCDGCGGRTLPCRSSCGAMTKGGWWDDEWCALCDGTLKAWPLSEEEKAKQREQLAKAAEERMKKQSHLSPISSSSSSSSSPASSSSSSSSKTSDPMDPSRWN